MIQLRPKLFRGRHFQDEIIILCVRWYLRYSLSYRDLARKSHWVLAKGRPSWHN
jgi:hypothetical protein